MISGKELVGSLLESYFGPAFHCEHCGNDTDYLVSVQNGVGEHRCFTVGCEVVSYEWDLE